MQGFFLFSQSIFPVCFKKFGQLYRIFKQYDLWDKEIFNCMCKTDNVTECGWNGMFDGKKCLPGVYAYYVYWKDQNGNAKNVAGDLTLVR